VVFYVMEFLRRSKPREDREIAWLPFDESGISQATHQVARDLIALVRERMLEMAASATAG